MLNPQSSTRRHAEAGKAIGYLLGAVLLVSLALFFSRLRGGGGGGDEGIESRTGGGIPPGLQADLQRMMEQWALTFKARDLTGHARLYRDPATWFGKSRTRQEIWLEKKKLLDAHPAIQRFEISGLRVEKFELGLATLTFTLRYDYGAGGAPPMQGEVLERLTCRSQGGDWKIESEYIEKEM